jgi:hypothetical protein
MDKLYKLIEQAILVAHNRSGDIDTEDGTFATTSTDEIIRLEEAIQEFTGLEASELAESLNANKIIENALLNTLKPI